MNYQLDAGHGSIEELFNQKCTSLSYFIYKHLDFFIPNLLLFSHLLKVVCCLDCRISAVFNVRFATDIMNNSFDLCCRNKSLLKRWIFSFNEKLFLKQFWNIKSIKTWLDIHWFSVKMCGVFSVIINIFVLKFTALCWIHLHRDTSLGKWSGKKKSGKM